MRLGMVSDWLKKHWRRGDFQVVPLCTQKDIVGRITKLTCSNEQITQPTEQNASTYCKEPVRPIAERIKTLADKASRKRQVASKPKRRVRGKG